MPPEAFKSADYSRTIEPKSSVTNSKKIYTYNIISNQPIPKVLPARARLPYGYALSIDGGKLEAINKLEAERTQMSNQSHQDTRDEKSKL
jgi:hypothetical protein